MSLLQSGVFRTLIARKLDGLYLRLILYIYTNVRWCSTDSTSFKVKNGIRQGAVSSGILFAVNIDELLTLLRNSGLGFHIYGIFMEL